ncbi:hypothetical protein F4680DRAFT_467839 [Xylaria scruposa]|nr:hypothetical protein F4680DRAFT_467839 [Xylaria scruposa]
MADFPSSLQHWREAMQELDFAGTSTTLQTITLGDLQLFAKTDKKMSGSTMSYIGFLMLRPIINLKISSKARRFLTKATLITDTSWTHTKKLFQGQPESDASITNWFDESLPMARFFNFCRVIHEVYTNKEYPNNLRQDERNQLGPFYSLLHYREDIVQDPPLGESLNVIYLTHFINAIIMECYNVLQPETLPVMQSPFVAHTKEYQIGDLITSRVDGYLRIPLTTNLNASIVFIVEAKRSTANGAQLQYQIISELSSIIYDRRRTFSEAFKTGSKKQHLLLVQFAHNKTILHLASFGIDLVKYLSTAERGQKWALVYEPEAEKNWLTNGFLYVQKLGPYNITSSILDMVEFGKLCTALFLTASETSTASVNLHKLATDRFIPTT